MKKKNNPFDELAYYEKELNAIDETRRIFDKKYAKVLDDKTCHRFKIAGDYGIVHWMFRFDDYAPKQLTMIPNKDFNKIHGLRLTAPIIRELHKFLGQFLEHHDKKERTP